MTTWHIVIQTLPSLILALLAVAQFRSGNRKTKEIHQKANEIHDKTAEIHRMAIAAEKHHEMLNGSPGKD